MLLFVFDKRTRLSLFRLDIVVTVQCEPLYFGVNCDRKCDDTSGSEHFTCDTNTGEKICKPGRV